jgi:hypothetical protein
LTACVTLAYVLHQDFWNWKRAYPVVFGLFPAGLFYHLVYTLAAALLMAVLVRLAWPAHLENSPERPPRPAAERRP